MARTRRGTASRSSATSGRGSQRFAGALDTLVVDVVVGDQAHDPRSDGAGDHALVGEMREQLARLAMAEDHHVRLHTYGIQPGVWPSVGHRFGQSGRPA